MATYRIVLKLLDSDGNDAVEFISETIVSTTPDLPISVARRTQKNTGLSGRLRIDRLERMDLIQLPGKNFKSMEWVAMDWMPE